MTAQEAVDKGHDIARETNSPSPSFTALVFDDENDGLGFGVWQIEFRKKEYRYDFSRHRGSIFVWEFKDIKKFPH